MTVEITTITLKNRFASVNCYLLKSGDNFMLIDTGWASKRSNLEKELKNAGCTNKNLQLIILTHGDFDHCGNCAYLRNQLNSKVAMHYDDSGMVEGGDMFWNRTKPNLIFRLPARALFKLEETNRFKPELYMDDDFKLSEYGFHGRVVHIPGHSKGSIGILTKDGELICGDLFENKKKPALNSIMDDPASAKASVEKLQKLNINIVYPGHGNPFLFDELFK
jgi:hydroxyacylglutathione hydrolase